MPKHDIFVIGGSAGALQPLVAIVEALPKTLEASVLVAMHTASGGTTALPQILSRASQLPVSSPRDYEIPERGHVYVAPADVHLLVTPTGMRLSHGPRENGFRPAIDPLFRTAAREFGPRVTGVVLSGALSDGAYGLNVIKQHGGMAIVQDPGDAVIDSMPRSAIASVEVDYVLPASRIAAELERLSQRATDKGDQVMARTDDLEPQLLSENTEVAEMERRFGAPSPITCPDCGGSLWEVHDGRVVRYQCHVGHQYAPDALEHEQRDSVDAALWTAVRALEEQAALKARMAERAAANRLSTVADGFREGARDAHAQAQQIRSVLFAAATPAVSTQARQPRTRARKARRSSRKR